jgi:hypothetical protein
LDIHKIYIHILLFVINPNFCVKKFKIRLNQYVHPVRPICEGWHYTCIISFVLFHLYYFICIISLVLFHLYYFICIISLVLFHLYYFTCIISFVLFHLYYFICIILFVLVHLYYFTCIISFVLFHLYYFICFIPHHFTKRGGLCPYGGTIHYREITLKNQLNVLIIWCLFADFKHLGDQNHREKSCYVANEFIALSLLVGIC